MDLKRMEMKSEAWRLLKFRIPETGQRFEFDRTTVGTSIQTSELRCRRCSKTQSVTLNQARVLRQVICKHCGAKTGRV